MDSSAVLPLPPTAYYVLLTLADRKLHGYGIMQAFEELTAGEVKLYPGSLYATLARMLDQGLLAKADPPQGERSGGPKRTYYRITQFGREVARAESRRLRMVLRLAVDRKLVADSAL